MSGSAYKTGPVLDHGAHKDATVFKPPTTTHYTHKATGHMPTVSHDHILQFEEAVGVDSTSGQY